MNPDRERVRALIAGNMRGEYEQMADKALQHLQLALTYAKNAKAPRTVARIQLAISSAKGAVRAAGYRDQRPTRRLTDKQRKAAGKETVADILHAQADDEEAFNSVT